MNYQSAVKVGYVLKRYPRYSETFVVNEILAHEKAGLAINIFALRPPCDSHFQDKIFQVRAPVTYINKPIQGRLTESLNSQTPNAASYFWAELQQASKLIPDFWAKLAIAQGERASTVYQAAWLAQAVKQKGITHLHAHFGSVATSVTRLAAHFADIPYTFTAHAKDIFHQAVQFEDLQRKLQDAAAVVTVSDYNLKYLQEHYGTAAARVHRIYNGLDLHQLQYFSPIHRSPLILSVGRLVEKKGLSVLINACAILRQWYSDFQCQIVGTGPLEADLRQQIQRLELQSTVKIVGPRPQQEVFQIIQQAAVFAAPYVIGCDGNRDGLPTVLLESMALGTPCVSTDVTGIPEVVRDRETGLIVAQHHPEQLAIALHQLLTDTQLRVQLSIQARQLIESRFDIHCNTASLRALFHPAHTHTATTLNQLQEV